MAKSSVITTRDRTEFRIYRSPFPASCRRTIPTRAMAAVRKGNQEQKANNQDKAKGEDPILDNAEDTPPRLRLHAPDCIERGLQLPENARRTKSSVTTPIRAAIIPSLASIRVLNHILHRFPAASPRRPAIGRRSDPRGLCPKTNPAMAMAIINNGASEKTV